MQSCGSAGGVPWSNLAYRKIGGITRAVLPKDKLAIQPSLSVLFELVAGCEGNLLAFIIPVCGLSLINK